MEKRNKEVSLIKNNKNGKNSINSKRIDTIFCGKWDGSLFQILRDIAWKNLLKNKKDKESKIIF